MNGSEHREPCPAAAVSLRVSLRERVALIDTNPVNWQALQKDFESLGVPVTRSHAFFADGRWNIAEDGAFYSNFRTFAIKGARKVSSPQAPDTDALHAWLTLLRQRVPRFWGFMTCVKSERRALALESIDLPSDDTALREREHFRCNLVLGVRPIGDRFVLIYGLHRYLNYVNRRVASVTCHIDQSVYNRDGVLHDLREASIELCAQYETEADGVRLSRIASSAAPPDASAAVVAAAIEPFTHGVLANTSSGPECKPVTEALAVLRQKYLRIVRAKQDHTAQEFARQLGLSVSTIASVALENRRVVRDRKCTAVNRDVLLRAIDVSVDDWYDRDALAARLANLIASKKP
jgi:hypothetical protein